MLADWLLRKKTGYGNGARLAKWKKFERPAFSSGYGSYYSARTPSAHDQRLLPAHYQSATQIGNLDKYRFFSITPVTDSGATSEVSVCRCCAHVCYNEAERREHLRSLGCAKKLVKAYGLLLRDMKCVVCDAHSSTKKWGVPLHTTCEKMWMEEVPCTSALDGAFMVLEAQGGF